MYCDALHVIFGSQKAVPRVSFSFTALHDFIHAVKRCLGGGAHGELLLRLGLALPAVRVDRGQEGDAHDDAHSAEFDRATAPRLARS